MARRPVSLNLVPTAAGSRPTVTPSSNVCSLLVVVGPGTTPISAARSRRCWSGVRRLLGADLATVCELAA
jgi:hypothetical protein